MGNKRLRSVTHAHTWTLLRGVDGVQGVQGQE